MNSICFFIVSQFTYYVIAGYLCVEGQSTVDIRRPTETPGGLFVRGNVEMDLEVLFQEMATFISVTLRRLTQVTDRMDNRLSHLEKHVLSKDTRCPLGFTYVNETTGCYKAVAVTKTWYEASQECKNHHPRAHLAFIENEQEHNVIKALLNTTDGLMCSNGLQGSGVYTYGWWIGGQRTNPNTASTFVWKTDPASREKATYPLTYQNWAPEQPNYKDYFSEACLELVVSIDYRWNDANCDWRCCYVCEIDM